VGGAPAGRVNGPAGAGNTDLVTRVLRGAGLTVTGPRREVYQALAGQDRPASAGEVFDLLRARGCGLGLPSVYRVLHSFAAAGIVHVFLVEEQRFRVCAPGAHVHLVCQECGRVIERPADTVRVWLAAARRDADFVPDVERSDLYGVCGRCLPGDGGPRPDTPAVRATRRRSA
jgi:Fur family transcriptional regulator, ferric uptake regulator